MDKQHGPARWTRNAILFLWGFCGITAFAIAVEVVARVFEFIFCCLHCRGEYRLQQARCLLFCARRSANTELFNAIGPKQTSTTTTRARPFLGAMCSSDRRIGPSVLKRAQAMALVDNGL
jgi:hypothetical protein